MTAVLDPAHPADDDPAAEMWALVQRAQAGDTQAFGQIYDRYLDTVFRFIYFRVGSRPLAEDLTADTFDGPEGAVVDHLTHLGLIAAVKQLNPEQQECIVLRFLQGFTVAETAQAMGKNEGAIKALQYRAVRALHRLLPNGFEEGRHAA